MSASESPGLKFGAAHQAAAAAESAKRIDALRQRLEQYNAAIARAMGVQGNDDGGAEDTEDDDDDYTDADSDEEAAAGGDGGGGIGRAGLPFDVEHYIRKFKQSTTSGGAAAHEVPGSTSRPLFSDSYREDSFPSRPPPTHIDPRLHDDDDTEETEETDEDYEEEEMTDDSEGNYHSFEEEEEDEPRLGNAAGPSGVPPWLRGAMFPNQASPPKPKQVERCLSSELRHAASVSQSAPHAAAPASFLDDTMLGAAIDYRINSPNPDEPSYSFRDLENAYHRISKIEQSVKKLSAFGMLEPKLPFADRVQELREERVRLLAEESDLAHESRELQRLVLPELAESDTNTHHDMQTLLQDCKSESRFRAVHERISIIDTKQTMLTDKVRRMQETFSHLQRKKQLSTSSDTHNVTEASRLKVDGAALVKSKDDVEKLEQESAARAEEVATLQRRVENWLAVLKDRDRSLDERGIKMQQLGEQLQKRQELLVTHKENRMP